MKHLLEYWGVNIPTPFATYFKLFDSIWKKKDIKAYVAMDNEQN